MSRRHECWYISEQIWRSMLDAALGGRNWLGSQVEALNHIHPNSIHVDRTYARLR